MLKKSIIVLISLIFISSCSTNKTIKKNNTKKLGIIKKEKIYKKYYDEDTKLYSIDSKIVTIKDLKIKYPKYAKAINEDFAHKKAKFLREELLAYLQKNKIKNYKILLPVERNKIDLSNKSQSSQKDKTNYNLVVFSDFQCPYCSKYAKEFEREVKKNKNINVVFKNFPLSFHQNAKDAAIASICAATQDKFWEFHDKLFKNQNKLSDGFYLDIAKELNLDQTKFMECLTSPETKKILQKDIDEGIKLGVRGTPTYFLNGVLYNESRNINKFNKIYKSYKKSDKEIKYKDLNNPNAIIAIINNKNFTLNDFYKISPKLIIKFDNDIANKAYSQLKQLTETDVVNVIFTKEAKLNKFNKTEEYIDNLIKKEVKEPSDKEVKVLYDAYKNRLRGASFEQVKAQLKDFMMKSKIENFFKKQNLKLIKKYNVIPLLLPPKFIINFEDNPVLGNKKAKNTVFVFSDFQCPYCARLAPITEKLSKEKNIKIVFKFFPLGFHKRAFSTAVAAYCAYKQNKFWKFHDKAFNAQYQLTEENFLNWAKELKLNIEEFKKCASSKKTKKRIQKDLDEGASIGVQGTPSLFINGMIYENDPSDIDKINEFIKKIK